MSVPVALDVLAEKVASFPSPPYLVTASADGRVHLVSVSAAFDGERFTAPTGRSTRANIGANPSVTLLWAGRPGEPYSLIVDGTATPQGDDAVAIEPARAVLHRVADASAELPSCVPLDASGQE